MPQTTTRGDEAQALVPGLRFVSDRHMAGTARLTLMGELDLATAARAAARIRRAQAESRVLVCDLSGVWFLDVSGLRVLLDAAAYAELSDRRLLVANAPSILRRMLRLLKLEHALEVPLRPLPSRTAHLRLVPAAHQLDARPNSSAMIARAAPSPGLPPLGRSPARVMPGRRARGTIGSCVRTFATAVSPLRPA